MCNIYCCIKNMSYQKKCHKKGRIEKEDHQIIATFKKCTTVELGYNELSGTGLICLL
jgi:hypothetical protein